MNNVLISINRLCVSCFFHTFVQSFVKKIRTTET